MNTLAEEIIARCTPNPDTVILLATNGETWTAGEAARTIAHLAGQVQAAGVAAHQRVAVVLPNGPRMALTFLAISSVASCAPLNPAYRSNELERYLARLDVRLLIVPDGQTGHATAVATSLGIPVCRLIQREKGLLSLAGLEASPPQEVRWSRAEDVALVLHTSGTTAHPKQVPLTHYNLLVSAANIGSTLRLTPEDRCLNVMPLYHIHGLAAGLLAPLIAGGSVICPESFSAPDFLEWLTCLRPTWYTAVPTMHQTLLARVRRLGVTTQPTTLRFVRSSSASLPPPVLYDLEATFGVPVIEAYGMTEAAHQMASNPLPPAPRKAGSVGLPAGPDISILAQDGVMTTEPDVEGEVVIRGDNVMAGYVAHPEANREAFVQGWFHTGDLGRFDKEGYLFLSGRLKEMINRGGEKIAPREVDEVLLAHPAVAQAIAFAIPDARLGEEIAAAVVRAEGAFVSESDLRKFVSERLALFKTPKRILFVDELPTGGTGKVQRIGLAEKLGILQSPGVQPDSIDRPPTPIESALLAIWKQVLQLEHIDIHSEFLSLGGDSLQAMRIAIQIQEELDIEVSISDLLAQSTVARMALLLTSQLISNGDQEGQEIMEHV